MKETVGMSLVNGFTRVHQHDNNGELETELSHERALLSGQYYAEKVRDQRGNGAAKKWKVRKIQQNSKSYTVYYNAQNQKYHCSCPDFVFRSKEKPKKPRQKNNGTLSYFNSVNLWLPVFKREMPEDYTRGVILGAFKGCKHIMAVQSLDNSL